MMSWEASSPQLHCTVPAPNTMAPDACRYCTRVWWALPLSYTLPWSWMNITLSTHLYSVCAVYVHVHGGVHGGVQGGAGCMHACMGVW